MVKSWFQEVLDKVKANINTGEACCWVLYVLKVTVLPTARHPCYISSKGVMLAGRNDAEMGFTNSLLASA